MKRSFFLFAVTLGAFVIGTTAHAQFTNNPMVTLTTNVTALTPIGNGFGVALLGYGLPEYNTNMFLVGSSNVFFFATPMGQPSASDATVSNSVYQFYVVSTDKDGNCSSNQSDLVAFKVSSPLSSPGNLTVVRTWPARAETNNIGSPQAGSLAACGITKSGTITVRGDGTQSPNGNAVQQAMFVFNANSLSTVVISNLIDNAALALSCLVTNDGDAGATVSLGSMGRNQGLLSGSTFGNTQFVARVDITSDFPPHGQIVTRNYSRGIHSINDTAKVLALWRKTQDEVDLGDGSDACTHLAVFYYNDNGGDITLDTSRGGGSGSNDWAFGTRTGDDLYNDRINTNAIDFFGATPVDGPAQISINDNGEMAFPVAINCYVGNVTSNGTRSADVTGILFKDANTGTFRKVVDTSDTSLFAPPQPGPMGTMSNNLVSSPALDNRGNVFFEATLTNFVAGGTNNICETALYQSVPNQYPNPTSWTTRVLLREGDTFIEPTSGHTIKIEALPLATCEYWYDGRDVWPENLVNVPRSLGANSINRTPFPGTTNSLGGVIICATLSNLTAGLQYDGLLYLAPLSYTPFRITSITRSGNDVKLVWNGQAGSNVVEVSVGGAGGSYSNNFADVTNIWLSGSVVTNYTDVGGATNRPSRFYRVRLVP